MANVTTDFTKYVDDIKMNATKAKMLDDIRNRLCNTCKYNKGSVSGTYCTLLNRNNMQYCSEWAKGF